MFVENRALPLTLLSFTAEVQARTAVLQWRTTNEREMEGFRLERSTDGRQFYRLAQLPAGAPALPGGHQKYRFQDHQSLDGTSFYRLRMIDLDGTDSYSEIQQIELAPRGLKFSLSPNPSIGGEIVVHLVSRYADTEYQVRIVDEVGRVAYTTAQRTASTDCTITIPVTLPQGNYFVRLWGETGDFLTHKLVVLH